MSALERERPESCLSDLTLDRMLVGELDERGELGAHLQCCDDCRARLAALRAESAAFDPAPFLARATPATTATTAMPPAVHALPATRRVPRWRRWAVPAAMTSLAAAAALALLVRTDPGMGMRAKGLLQLDLIARRSSGVVEQVLSGSELQPGEAIRFRVSSSKAGYLAIVGLDSKPSVTAYRPSEGETLPLKVGRDQLLDGSIILDETLGPERIVAVLCSRPIAVADVVAAGRRALEATHGHPAQVGVLDLACNQVSVLITKSRPPTAGEPPAATGSAAPR